MVDIHEIAKQMVTPGKGLLAADESNPSANKRLASIDVLEDKEHRRQYRELFINAKGMEEFISGVILYDETMSQVDNDGKAFLDTLKENNVLIGIKVDEGKDPDLDSEDETVTKGLYGLEGRLTEYKKSGAVFAKWRAVIKVDAELPTESNIRKEAENLAEYAKVCQKVGIVPIIEPEVLKEGDHSIEQAEKVLEQTLTIVFDAIKSADVDLKGMILKTSMVVAGSEQSPASPEEVAERTVRILKKTVPTELAGIVFLSGGQEPVEATENLNAINQLQPLPWPTTFSFARALQVPSINLWRGDESKIDESRDIFLHRASLNSLASKGEYSSDLE